MPRNAADTKARIIEAAQSAFAERGYSQTGVRDIALRAGVASSLIIKYFGTKSNLFGEALKQSLAEAAFRDELKPQFGETLIGAITDRRLRIDAPAMIALSLGDDEARQVSASVIQQHVIDALAAWLGPPQAQTRAINLLVLGVGFAILNRHLGVKLPAEIWEKSGQWFSSTIQDIVDTGRAEPASGPPGDTAGGAGVKLIGRPRKPQTPGKGR